MYQYTICDQPDIEIFKRQCTALEKHIPGIKKDYDLEDIDGSVLQYYRLGESRIKVSNDYYIGAVLIDSDIKLEPFFTKKV